MDSPWKIPLGKILKLNQNLPRLLFLLCMVGVTGCSKSNLGPILPAKNPFGVKDVGEIDYDEVRKFAATTFLSGTAHDPNAKNWTDLKNGAEALPTIEGDWESRWNGGSAGTEWRKGRARIKRANDSYFIFYQDNSRYLIEGKIDKDVFIGRYLNLDSQGDAGPWVGKVVSMDRIDGQWSQGRWDFRR